jgi:MFS transporter, SP family, sugar:H+ symporter
MCWQLVLSVSQIIAAGINKGTEGINSTASYRVPMGVQLLFPLIMLAGLWWVPESPRWLLRQGEQAAAENALLRVIMERDTLRMKTLRYCRGKSMRRL